MGLFPDYKEDYMDFTGKVVLITGATGGIGSAAAGLFAQNGAIMALHSTKKQSAEALAEKLGLKGNSHIALEADVAKEEDVRNSVEAVIAKFGRIDVLFNNAGVEGKMQPIPATTADNLDKVFQVNVYGVYYFLKYVLPVMMSQKSGSVINTASVAGLQGFPGMAPYVASKHAVLGITRTAALEAVAAGVRVNAVCPAPVDTRMMRAIEAVTGDPAAARKGFESIVPMGRYADPAEIAQLVYFLASDKSSFITGATYLADGGMTAGIQLR